MSKKNNLNPDFYKTAGRGRQGDAVDQASHRQKFTEEEARRANGGKDSLGRTSEKHEMKEGSKLPPASGRDSAAQKKKERSKLVPAGGGKGKREGALQQPQRSPRRGAGSGRKAGSDVAARRGPRDQEPGDEAVEDTE